MWYRIHFLEDIIEDSYQQVDEEDIGHEEIGGHGYWSYPTTGFTWFESRASVARWIYVIRKHLSVQHEVRLVEYLG